MATEKEKIKKQEKKAKAVEAKENARKSQIYGVVTGEDWQVIRKVLIGKVAELNSIVDMDDQDITRQDVLAAKKAIKIVLGWIMEIEGDARAYAIEAATLKDRTKEEIILNLEGEDE